MSRIVTVKEFGLSQIYEPIAESMLEIKVKDFSNIKLPYEIFSEKIQLMEFSDAYWSVKIRCTHKYNGNYAFYFTLKMAEVQEELQKNCFIKFCCKSKNTQFIDKTIPYQSTFNSDVVYSSFECAEIFTVNLVIVKNAVSNAVNTISMHSAPRKQLLDNISNTYGDEIFSDFTFIVKGKQFKVHKSILAASSAVMRKLFTAEYKEKETGQCVIDDIEADIFEALIRFMYSCTVPANFSDIVYELYPVAHYYEIETLKDICVEEMQKNLSKQNANEAHILAFKYNLEKLSADVWKIIKRDILKVYLPENVEPLSPDEVAQILASREKEQAFYKKHTKVEEKEESESK